MWADVLLLLMFLLLITKKATRRRIQVQKPAQKVPRQKNGSKKGKDKWRAHALRPSLYRGLRHSSFLPVAPLRQVTSPHQVNVLPWKSTLVGLDHDFYFVFILWSRLSSAWIDLQLFVVTISRKLWHSFVSLSSSYQPDSLSIRVRSWFVTLFFAWMYSISKSLLHT